MKMDSPAYHTKKLYPIGFPIDETPVELRVFSNHASMFHEETMKRVQSVVQEMSCYGYEIEVSTQSIEDCEEQNIIALPTLVIGNTQITGLPTRRELGEILRKSIPHRGAEIE